MKKTIAAALTLFALSTGMTFAQGVYSRPYDNRPSYSPGSRYNNDQVQDELKVDRIDAIVGLSRRQERQLRRIEESYDGQMARSRMTPDGYRQLQRRKRHDILAVLTSAQRDRLFAYQQQNNRSGNRRGNRVAPYGRRG